MYRKTLIALAGLALLGSAGCVEERKLTETVSSFQVELDQVYGTAEIPLAFPDAPMPVQVTVTALSNTGGPFKGLDFPVTLYTAPGKAQTVDGLTLVQADLVDGKGQADLTLQAVYGRTHVCAKDNLRGEDSTYAIGCTPTLYFDMPRIDQVQVTTDATTSPLLGGFIEVRSGDLIVTGILAEGFYVTDLEAPAPAGGLPGDFGSLFIYSFSFPEGVVIGDRLSSVIGTVQEFTGSTQLTFPSWTRKEVPTDRCSVPWMAGTNTDCPTAPIPVVLDDVICDAGPAPVPVPAGTNSTTYLCGHATDNILIESLEAAVVQAQNVVTPTNFVDCDYNLDGDVANFDASCGFDTDWVACEAAVKAGTATGQERACCEIACKSACNLDMTCSEASSLTTYGQWSGAMNGGAGPKVNFLTQQGFPELDLLKPEYQGIALDIAGTLRHSLPARPRWVVVARSAQDVVFRP
ncbi:MAG: hypothetical protein P1V51_25140 [Deltaproteobacteria bacterium]|nr:hypothetical protein [Deltaproteobacteria bacterium]